MAALPLSDGDTNMERLTAPPAVHEPTKFFIPERPFPEQQVKLHPPRGIAVTYDSLERA